MTFVSPAVSASAFGHSGEDIRELDKAFGRFLIHDALLEKDLPPHDPRFVLRVPS